tara:strand:+ start:2175 stop:2498 length:324 start_codon:yes stop_codon:yes gene_type:complete
MGFSDGNSLAGIIKSIREDSQYKKGGSSSLPKAQDGGPWKAMKNSAWQDFKTKPLVHGKQETSDVTPTVKPKTNWVNPPASVTNGPTDPRRSPSSTGMKMGGSKKRK